MRSVVLLRHGKSDRSTGVEDHERPLTMRGCRAAAAIGRFVSAAGQIPDLAVTSTAVRARETLRLAHEAGTWGCPTREDPRLYGASVADVLALIRREDVGVQRLLLVGHEPAWSATLTTLIGGGEFRMPTCAAGQVDFDVADWSGVEPGAGELAWFLPPRLIEG